MLRIGSMSTAFLAHYNAPKLLAGSMVTWSVCELLRFLYKALLYLYISRVFPKVFYVSFFFFLGGGDFVCLWPGCLICLIHKGPAWIASRQGAHVCPRKGHLNIKCLVGKRKAVRNKRSCFPSTGSQRHQQNKDCTWCSSSLRFHFCMMVAGLAGLCIFLLPQWLNFEFFFGWFSH